MHLRRDFLRSIEAGIIGFFLIQSIRYLYGTIYAHISSADLVRRVINRELLVDLPGYVNPADVERELLAIGIALVAPLIALFLYRTIWSVPLAVAVAVIGRSMALQVPDAAPLAAAMVIGAALTYMILTVIRRPAHFPAMLLLGIIIDQIVRASETSRDMTWNPDYELFGYSADVFFLGLAAFTLFISAFSTFNELEIQRISEDEIIRGTLTGWGSFALGAFFFIELTLLGLANVVARWADVDYAAAVPALLVATALPLIPFIRVRARSFLGAFDGVLRGWLWTLLLGLLFVLAYRFEGFLALFVLLIAQFITGLTLWWMIKPANPKLPNPTPILGLISIAVFATLSAGDYFTYDYAYVRDFADPFAPLADVLRSFKDFGLYLFLLSAIVLCMPMILERRVIPWRGGRGVESFITMVLVVSIAGTGTIFADRPRVQAPDNLNCLRIGTLNLHSGYTLLFEPNLDLTLQALSLRPNGTDPDLDIILLQETDTGRLSSFGVDQAEWLAQQLQMEVTFFPQNENLHGLAVLSRIPIRNAQGQLLESEGPQAAVLQVELALDENPLYVYNLWLGYQTLDAAGFPEPLEQQDQQRQTDEIEALIVQNHQVENFESRIIMGGTFNYDESSPLYSFWQDDTTFLDPFPSIANENRDTIFLVDGSSARYDYIWLMNIDPAGVTIDQNFVASDHRLAVVEINRTAGLPTEQQCGS